MAFVKKMKEGDKSPTLYTMYGKLYDFEEMRRAADAGLSHYLSTLKRGRKNEAELLEAYNNIMNGIKNGTITFGDGHYIDSTGTYDNMSEGKIIKNKNKDYYGLMANYIYNTLNSQSEYQVPEDTSKTKWSGSTGVGSALMRALYNSDSGNIQDFIDADDIDPTTKRRGTTNRASKLYDSFKYVYDNFDDLFTGYTDADKTQSLGYIKSAMDALHDGTIDAGDYLALSRAAGGLDYRNMFTDSYVEEPKAAEEEEGGSEGSSGAQGGTPQRLSLGLWILANYPQYTGELREPHTLESKKKYGEGAINALTDAISLLDKLDLIRMVRSIISDDNYVFNNEPFIRAKFKDLNYNFNRVTGMKLILQVMLNKGWLEKIGDLTNVVYYIPGTASKRQTAWVWDTEKNTVEEKSFHNIPYFQNKILKEYQAYAGTYGTGTPAWVALHPVYSLYLRAGGIIKADNGIKLKNSNWYSQVLTSKGEGGLSLLDYIIAGLGKDDKYYEWLNKMQDAHYGIYSSASADNNDYFTTAYRGDAVGDYQTKYRSGYNNEWGDNKIGYNSLGITNAYNASNYDAFGNTKRLSGDWGTGDDKWKVDLLFSGITDSRRLLGRQGDYDEAQLKEITEKFRAANYRFYLDKNGYYKLEPIKKQINPLTGGAPPGGSLTDDDPSDDTGIRRVQPDPSKSGLDFSKLRGAIPDMIDGYRLGLSIGTNNKIYKTVLNSLNPALINPDERFSPVTGAFQEMQYRSKQGADGLDRYSRPFTSDATLQLSGQLDAKRLADNLAYQGFIADDKEIKRTAAEALNRREWTHTNHIDVANKNAQSINQTERERAQLKATNQKQNWQSVDNFLKGISERQRAKLENSEAEMKNFRLQIQAADIEQKYQDAIQRAQTYALNWAKSTNYEKDITEMPNYENWAKAMLIAKRWKQAQLFSAQAAEYGTSYYDEYLNLDINQLLSQYKFNHGGKLINRK